VNSDTKSFTGSLHALIEAAPDLVDPSITRKVRVRHTNGMTAGAHTYRRTPKWLGYTIEIHTGFSGLLLSAATLAHSRVQILDESEKLKAKAPVSAARAKAILCEAVENYLTSLQWHPPITEILILPSMRESEDSPLIMSDFYLLVAYMRHFTIAHELGHIIRGHVDRTSSLEREARWAEEFEADDVAIKLLLKLIHSNYPLDPKRISEAEGRVYTEGVIATVTALRAISILFSVVDLVQEAARKRGMHGWKRYHPRGEERYVRLRNTCIENDSLPHRLFSDAVAGLPPPDHEIMLFQYLALDISGGSSDRATPETGAHSLTSLRGDVEAAWTRAETHSRSLRAAIDKLRVALEDAIEDSTDWHPELLDELIITLIQLARICANQSEYSDAALYCFVVPDYLAMLELGGVDTISYRAAVAETLLMNEALEKIQQDYIDNARTAGETEPEISAVVEAGVYALRRGDFEDAEHHFRRALWEYEEAGWASERGKVLDYLKLLPH
jgi:tetratricopeptide (TPR) repeat protein